MSADAPPASSYRREPEVETQIKRLLTAPRARIASIALGEPAREEVLVHLIRVCRRDGDFGAADALLRGLVARINSKVARTLAIWRLSSPQSLADDVIDEVIVDFYDQVLSDAPSEQFWEVRFWVCLERRLLNIVRKWRGELARISSSTAEDEEFGDTIEERQPAILTWDETPETQAIMVEALAVLPDDWRTAFLLKHWTGLTEESKAGDSDPTIASVMGVTGRMVRYYLKRSDERLAKWRVESSAVSRAASKVTGSVNE